MRRISGLCAIAVAVGCTLSLAGDARADRVFKKGPYLQNVSPSSVTILWETSSSRPATLRVTGPGVDRTETLPARRAQEIVVAGLDSSSRYVYSVEVDGVTEEGELGTAPEEGTDVPFTFAVNGDNRSGMDAHRRIVERISAEVPDFLLGTGDMVDEGAKQSQWQQFFDIERELLRDNVLFPSVGNHDRQGRGRTADSWRAFFAVPENSPDPERYYAFTYGNSRFLVLDSNMHSFALTDQTAWLESQLQSARQNRGIRHIFVVMHHPPFSVSLHGGHRDLRERWTPLYEKYGVDAVFSGHDHVYSRADKGGVRYFVTGGGGAPLYPRSPRAKPIDRNATRYFERVHHFLRVHVYGDLVEVTAVRVDGSTIETTTWGESPPVEVAPAVGAASVAAAAPLLDSHRIRGDTSRDFAAAPRRDRGLGWPMTIGMIGIVAVLGVLGAGWGVTKSRRRRKPRPRTR